MFQISIGTFAYFNNIFAASGKSVIILTAEMLKFCEFTHGKICAQIQYIDDISTFSIIYLHISKLNRWRYIFKYFGVISRHTFLSLQLHGDTSNFSSKTIKTKIKWNEKMIWSICHKLIISYMVLSSKVIISGSRNWARSNSKKIKIVYVFRFIRNNSKSFFGS